MTALEFQPWPKVPRLNREMIITEKIDGTNACIILGENGEFAAQSRKRLITPDDDNFGFAKWVWGNVGHLQATLGPGYHYGEWWGSGIQRGYGLAKGEKRFSLFNTIRWGAADLTTVEWLSVVPLLYHGSTFQSLMVDVAVSRLDMHGSVAAPGFMRPEGVIVYLPAANQGFKVTVEDDDIPKALAATA